MSCVFLECKASSSVKGPHCGSLADVSHLAVSVAKLSMYVRCNIFVYV